MFNREKQQYQEIPLVELTSGDPAEWLAEQMQLLDDGTHSYSVLDREQALDLLREQVEAYNQKNRFEHAMQDLPSTEGMKKTTVALAMGTASIVGVVAPAMSARADMVPAEGASIERVQTNQQKPADEVGFVMPKVAYEKSKESLSAFTVTSVDDARVLLVPKSKTDVVKDAALTEVEVSTPAPVKSEKAKGSWQLSDDGDLMFVGSGAGQPKAPVAEASTKPQAPVSAGVAAKPQAPVAKQPVKAAERLSTIKESIKRTPLDWMKDYVCDAETGAPCGQCVDYTKVFLDRHVDQGKKQYDVSVGYGHGKDFAAGVAKAMDVKLDNTPAAGAVVSFQTGEPYVVREGEGNLGKKTKVGKYGEYGHVAVVSRVFKNGYVQLSEYNMNPLQHGSRIVQVTDKMQFAHVETAYHDETQKWLKDTAYVDKYVDVSDQGIKLVDTPPQAPAHTVAAEKKETGSDTPPTDPSIDRLPGDTYEQKAMNFFIKKGLKPHQAAGIVGNIIVEGGGMSAYTVERNNTVALPKYTLDPKSLPKVEWVYGQNRQLRQPGWGIVGWTPATKAVTDYEKSGLPGELGGLESQLELVWWEINSNKSAFAGFDINKFKTTDTVDKSAEFWMREFERPGVEHLDRRIDAAKKVLEHHKVAKQKDAQQSAQKTTPKVAPAPTKVTEKSETPSENSREKILSDLMGQKSAQKNEDQILKEERKSHQLSQDSDIVLRNTTESKLSTELKKDKNLVTSTSMNEGKVALVDQGSQAKDNSAIDQGVVAQYKAYLETKALLQKEGLTFEQFMKDSNEFQMFLKHNGQSAAADTVKQIIDSNGTQKNKTE